MAIKETCKSLQHDNADDNRLYKCSLDRDTHKKWQEVNFYLMVGVFGGQMFKMLWQYKNR